MINEKPIGSKQQAVDSGPIKCYKLVTLLVNRSTKANPEGQPWLHSVLPPEHQKG